MQCNNHGPINKVLRTNTEEKVKVVAAVWGTEFDICSIPCHASCFSLGRFEE